MIRESGDLPREPICDRARAKRLIAGFRPRAREQIPLMPGILAFIAMLIALAVPINAPPRAASIGVKAVAVMREP